MVNLCIYWSLESLSSETFVLQRAGTTNEEKTRGFNLSDGNLRGLVCII